MRLAEAAGHQRAPARADAHRRAGPARPSRPARDSGQLQRQRPDHPPAADVPPRRPLPAEQAAREPAEALHARAVPVRQRPAGARGREQPTEIPDARHRHRRQAPQGELRLRLRHRGDGPRAKSTGVTSTSSAARAPPACARATRGSTAACGSTSRSRTSSAATTRSALQGQSWHTDEPAFVLDNVGGRVTVTREFGRARGAVLGARPDDDAVVHLRQRVRGLHDLRGGARGPVVPRRADRARPRTRETGDGQRPALVASASTPAATPPTTCSMRRRGYVATVHLEQAGELPRRRLQLLRARRPKGATTCRSRSRAVVAVRARGGSIDGIGETTEADGAVLQALLPRRRDQPARLGTLRVVAAERIGPADRRPDVHELLDRAARADLAATSAACCSSTAATSGRILGLQPQRPALRRRPGPALQHADRSDPRRLRLSAESRFPACWSTASPSRAASASTSASARRSKCTMRALSSGRQRRQLR